MNNYELKRSIDEINESGREAENAGDLEAASKYYEESIKIPYADAFSYSRLMMIYRRFKKPADELRVIKKGIKIFTEQQEQQLQGRKSKKISELSNAFMTRSGLKDRKGNFTFFPEPVNKWMKRKFLVEEKIKKKSASKKK